MSVSQTGPDVRSSMVLQLGRSQDKAVDTGHHTLLSHHYSWYNTIRLLGA